MITSQRFFAISMASILASACGGGGPQCTHQVSPSSDDQTAVQEMLELAADGDTLCFNPGTYDFTDPIDFARHDRVTIRGTGSTRAAVVLDWQHQTVGSNGLSVTAAHDFTIENMTLLDATGNNLFITGSENVTIRNVSSGWVVRPPNMRGKYALYPVQSTNVLVEDSEAFGSSDAGIYVGQTTHCIIRNNLARENVAGIEIENSSDCEVYGNEAHHNTAGILVFELPGLPTHGTGTAIHDNDSHDNNTPNFASDGIVMLVPTGIGIMSLAANDAEIFDNSVENNNSAGIVVVAYETMIVNDAVPDPMDPSYDTWTEGVWLHGNTFAGNGSHPDSLLALVASSATPPQSTLEDVVRDGAQKVGAPANDFCFQGTGTFRNGKGLMMFMNQSTDRAAYDCTRPARPPVTLPQD